MRSEAEQQENSGPSRRHWPSRTIQGAQLQFHADLIEVDLAALQGRIRRDPVALPTPPAVAVPPLSALSQLTLRSLSLKEILEHADAGSAVVTLPLMPRTLSAGPLSLSIEAGTRVVFDLVVNPGGFIDREHSKGRIEPPLELPLGKSVRGVYIDKSGNLVADLQGLPDLNLSMLVLRGQKIPLTLDELLGLLFDPTRESDGGPPLIDVGGIVVDAAGVVPRADALVLGKNTHIAAGPGTRLDVHYDARGLHISGPVEVDSARIAGAHFDVVGLSGRAVLDARVVFSVNNPEHEDAGADPGSFSLSLSSLSGQMARATVALPDGSALAVAALAVQDASLAVKNDAGTLSYRVNAPKLEGELGEGQVQVAVGGQALKFHVESGRARRLVDVAHNHARIDLEVEDAALRMPPLSLSIPFVSLDVNAARCRATGRVRAGTDLGVAFHGALDVSGDLNGGTVEVGAARATLGAGTRVDVSITDVAAGPEGLEVLQLSGNAVLAVAGGRLPLFGDAALALSSGALATLKLDAVRFAAGRFPVVAGAITLSAAADPLVLDAQLLSLPPSDASVEARFELSDQGLLALRQIALALKAR